MTTLTDRPNSDENVRYVTTRAGRLGYEEFGSLDAPPVIFIRGTGAEGRRWMPQVTAYQKAYRCVIFDNRGVGRSDTPPSPYSVADMAGDVLDLMDHLSIADAHLSGSSLGGAIALHIAAYHPERVRTLQLHASWLSTTGYSAYSLGLLRRILDIGGVNFYYQATIPLLFSADFLGENYAEVPQILQRMIDNATSEEGLSGQLEANLSHDLSAVVNRITVPTLITVGENDLLLPPAESRRLHESIPGSEFIVFPRGGHLVSVEDADAFNAATLEWLQRHT
jgi:aminoacrylate hydrolase